MDSRQIIIDNVALPDMLEAIRLMIQEEVKKITPEKVDSDTKYLNRKELAQLLGLSQQTISLYTKTGTIPSARMGRQYRYNLQKVRAALDKELKLKNF